MQWEIVAMKEEEVERKQGHYQHFLCNYLPRPLSVSFLPGDFRWQCFEEELLSVW